ncbi:biotin/lipoyl-containing protein [Maridesulfovibrio sp.]|uniref:biotin/lipoyl-containing protein n=1 Tax=Maridesulfovibrio sp. TaxID=2795000 RepID=UPI003BABFDE0
MAKKKIRFMCTAFRDGFQSVYGARVKTDDFLPAVEATREAGVDWFEAGGGARFQALYFYSNECAFDMMDRFRETAGPDADLQTLARGVNVVGLESQPSDVIKAHADLFAKHGITTIRNFDALNDVNNLIYSGQCIADAGLKHQVVVSMMELPPGCSGAHDAAFYEKTLRQILDADIPFDSVCFKDASGTSTPAKVYETIKAAKKMLPEDVLLHFHTHETAGIGGLCYHSAIEAGADAIDLSMAPASGGTCQTDIITMWHILRGTDYTIDVDIDKIIKAEDVFRDCMKDYFLPPEATQVDPMIPFSPMPGGALTANTQMLRDNGLMDKYPEIIRAMSEVVRKGGFGTSVTPVSQFYFQQAFNNVMFGPWKKFADGYGKMVLGYFGKTPVEPDPEIVKLASEQMELEPTKKTPLEINDADPSKGLAPAREICEKEGFELTDENIFIVATCKDKGVSYLKGDARIGIRYKKDVEAEQLKKLGASVGGGSGSGPVNVTVDGQSYTVNVDGSTATINGKSFNIGAGDAPAAGGAAPAAAPAGATEPIAAPMPGLIIRMAVDPGTQVQEGQTIIVMEAMKMEMEVKAHKAGTVTSFSVTAGDQVQQGQPLAQMTV